MADEDIIIKLRLQGQQELDAAFRKIDSSAKNLGTSFGRFGDSMKNVAKNIGLVTTAIAGAGAAIVGLTAKVAENSEQVDKVALQTGIARGEIESLGKIAEDSGSSQEAMNKSLLKLTKNLHEFKDPTSAASKELEELAPGLRANLDAAGSTGEAFQILKATLSGISDETAKANIIQATFGKTGLDIIPVLEMTNEELNKQRQFLKAIGFELTPLQGQVLATFDEAFDKANTAIAATGKQLAVVFAPALTLVADAITNFIANNQQKLIDFAQLITGQVTTVVKDLFLLLSTSGEAKNVSNTAKQIYDGFVRIRDAVVGGFTAAKGVLTAFFAALTPIAAIFGLNGMQLGVGLLVTQLLGVNRAIVDLVRIGPALIKFALSLAGAIGPLVTTLLPGLVLMLGRVGTALKLLGVALLTNPVFLIGAAIVAIVAAIAIVIDKTIGWAKAWELLKAAVSTVFKFIADGLKVVVGFLAGLGKAFIDGFVAATPGLQKFLSDVSAMISGWIQKAGALFKGLGPMLTDAFRGAGTAIGTLFDNVFSGIGKAFNAIVEKIKSSIQTISGLIKSAADAVSNVLNRSKQQSQVTLNPPRYASNGKQLFGPGFADGGLTRGPGTGTSDSIMARLSNGEFVIKAAAVKKFGAPFFAALNSGILPALRGFASGGLVNAMDSMTAGMGAPRLALAPASSGPTGTPINLYLPNGQVIQARTNSKGESIARGLQKELRSSASAKAGKTPRWYL